MAERTRELETANSILRQTQLAIMQHERLRALGQMASGIAHDINNDLTRPRWHDMAQEQGIVIDLEMQVAPDLPLIRGVESEIRHALMNLILNAVDAMPNGGALTLRVSSVAARNHAHPAPTKCVRVEVR